MRYLPHTSEEIDAMLKTVGVEFLDDLFSTVPQDCRRRTELDLPDPLTEWELDETMGEMAAGMAVAPDVAVYLGGGSYEHFVPAAASHLLSRSEFVTSYTPYQPEMSQGTLQGIYEYQTLTARLLGLEVANASLYDGATALAEALLMAIRVSRHKTVAVSRLIHPLYRQVVNTYLEPTGYRVIELPYLESGRTDLSSIAGIDDLAAVAIQSPNFFGCIETLDAASEAAHERGGLMVACFTEAMAYGLLKSPGSLGADIACGDGQSFGVPQSFGGPRLGMFATRMKYVRSMPGRLVGKTVDADGRRGFVLTLSTREQHIRREKATSNICTNNSLCAMGAAIFMAAAGGSGLRQLAALNRDKAEYLKAELKKAGIAIPFASPTFNEFVAAFPPDFEKTRRRLMTQHIIAGLPLESHYPELSGHYLLCVTETKARCDLDTLVREVTS
jgi:glycine dehydrogenase subunit 1